MVPASMTFGETVLLGALAGFTIYLGLPFGRIQFVSTRARVALAMFSVGVLAFLFAEVLVHGVEIVEEHFEELGEGEGSSARALGSASCSAAVSPPAAPGLALVEKQDAAARRTRRRSPAAPPTR